MSAHTEQFRCHLKAAIHNVRYRETYIGLPIKSKRIRKQSRGDYVMMVGTMSFTLNMTVWGNF